MKKSLFCVEHPNMGFSVGEVVISNILKDSKNLQRDCKFFKESYKKHRHEKYRVINEILYKWYGKCTSANVCPDGPFLQKEAMEITKRLEKEDLIDFTASNR